MSDASKTPGIWRHFQIDPSWIQVDALVTARMRSVNLEDIALKKDVDGIFWAPVWASIVCAMNVHGAFSERSRQVIIKHCALDAELGRAISTLLTAIEEEDERVELLKSVLEEALVETALTIVCQCGKKFDSRLVWRQHSSSTCPFRTGVTS